MLRYRIAGAIVLALGLIAPASGQMTAKVFRDRIAANALHREQQFVELGLAPALQVAAAGRSVRRFRYSVWIPSTIPVVELERMRSGRTVMRLLRPGQSVVQRSAPDWLWPRLAALDAQIFAEPEYEAARLAKPVSWSSCHGDQIDLVRIEKRRVSSAGGNQCANSPVLFSDAMRAVVAAYAEALISTEPGCNGKVIPDGRDSLGRCYRSAPDQER